MTDLIERTRQHVGSYKTLTKHRQDCLALCEEIERLTADLKYYTDTYDKQKAANERLLAKVEQLEGKINAAVNVGHNDDCMFCGFKDRALTTDVVLDQQQLKKARAALKGADDE